MTSHPNPPEFSFWPTPRLQTRLGVWKRLLWSLAAAWILVGCVSTQERFEKAASLEEQGRFEDAAYQYVDVLERESSFPNARRALLRVATEAMAQRMREAESAEASGQPVQAAQVLTRVQDLHDACRRVDVDVPLPNGYASYRRTMDAKAADALVADAERAREEGEWPAALAAYEEARTYARSEDRRIKVDEDIAEVLLNWSDDDMLQGRYRTAYERVGRVPSLVGPEHPLVEEARAMRQTAVERGTRRVALLPLWRTDEAAGPLPPDWLDDLNVALQAEYGSPPPFLITADPVATRRVLRRLGLDDAVRSTVDAEEAGRQLEADFVVVGDVTAFEEARDDLETETRTAAVTPQGRGPTSGRPDATGPDTTFVVERYDLEVEAVVAYRVVQVATGRVLDEGEIVGRGEGPVEEGRYAGDWRNLDLSGREVDYFDPEVLQRQRRPIYDAVLDEVAATLTDRTYDEVLRAID